MGCGEDPAPDGAPQLTPVSAPGSTPAVEVPAGGNRALVVVSPQATVNTEQVSGSGPAAGSQQPRAGIDEVVVGPRAQEDVVMDAVCQ